MNKRTVFVITENNDFWKKIDEHFRPFKHVLCKRSTSVSEFKTVLSETPFSGVIVDLKVLLKTTPNEKEFFNQLENSFSVGRVSVSRTEDIVSGFVKGKSFKGHLFFEYYYHLLQFHTQDRFVRFEFRQKAILNLRISFMSQLNPLLTNSLNISMGGMFVICPQPPPVGTELSIQIHDIPEMGNLSACVKWSIPWGVSRTHISGFGVEFQKPLNDQQIDLLKTMFRI